MNLVSIKSSAAAIGGGITGIRYSFATEQDTLPGTPALVIGMARNAQVIAGDRQVTNFELPFRLYIESVSTRPRDSTTADGYVNAVVTTYALNQGLAGSVQQAYVTGWDTDVRYAVGNTEYEAVDFTLGITVHEQVNQHL